MYGWYRQSFCRKIVDKSIFAGCRQAFESLTMLLFCTFLSQNNCPDCRLSFLDHFEGLEAELTMSKNVILRKTHFKVSIKA